MSENAHSVSEREQGMRLDALLATLAGVGSRSSAVRLIEQGAVRVNGEVSIAKKRIVVANDELRYTTHAEAPRSLSGEYIPLDIRYEDDDLIVLSKQANLVCHPSLGHESGTLVNALIAHCGYANLAQLQGEERPGIVHRLDKDTTGLMLVAKSDEAGRLLQDEIRIRSVDRRYLTLVHGYIAPDNGMIDAPIARGDVDRQRMVVSNQPHARSSITTFTVFERFEAGRFDEGYSLLECKLYTGRTHQIRVHMNYIAHPVVGDPLYGLTNKPKAQLGLTRQFLHSYRLVFTHPLTGESMEFTDALPADLEKALKSIEGESMGRTQMGEEVLGALS
ncbi:MAG: RluA family pseudouridine synthase [Coriobacteriales bacterium]|jgi:23S rRNA pseudouridine1911/1915/1917 synthase|nr:RluA family pseudouridine synthase [Coriobacteriales bacterium]